MTANKYELVNVTTGKKAVLETKSGTLGPDCLNIANITRDHGAFTFDPGFMATAILATRSKCHCVVSGHIAVGRMGHGMA